jgi:hypothetical protein
MSKQFLAINRLLNGWGIVDGKFVYVPLWDPPKDLGYRGYKEFYVASALKAAVPFVQGALGKQLDAIAHKHANLVSGNIAGEWDGDICPPFKVWPPHHHLPVSLGDLVLPEAARIGLAGALVHTLGEQIGNHDISRLGREIEESVKVNRLQEV